MIREHGPVNARERKDHRLLEPWKGNHWYRREEENLSSSSSNVPEDSESIARIGCTPCVRSHAIRVVERDSMRNFKFSSFFDSIIVLSIFDFFPSLSLSFSFPWWKWLFSHVSRKILSLCVFLLSDHFPLPFSPCVKLDFTLGFRNPRHTRLHHVSFYLFLFLFFFFSFYRSRFTGNRHFFSSFLRCCIIIYIYTHIYIDIYNAWTWIYYLFSILHKFDPKFPFYFATFIFSKWKNGNSK